MNSFRFGILGAGNIAGYFCNGVKLVEGAEVAAVASKSLERARAFAQRNGIPDACGSYDELLARSDIDAVYIATTHNFHMELIDLFPSSTRMFSFPSTRLAGSMTCPPRIKIFIRFLPSVGVKIL